MLATNFHGGRKIRAINVEDSTFFFFVCLFVFFGYLLLPSRHVAVSYHVNALGGNSLPVITSHVNSVFLVQRQLEEFLFYFLL